MSKHGGKRIGSGRKPKSDEIQFIEKLKPLEGLAFTALKEGLEKRTISMYSFIIITMLVNQKKQRTHINEDVPLFID